MKDRIVNLLILLSIIFVFVQFAWAQASIMTSPLLAPTMQERMSVEETKLGSLQEKVQALEKLEIDHRLTMIETLLKTGNYLQYTSTGGLLILGVEAYTRRRKKRQSDSD